MLLYIQLNALFCLATIPTHSIIIFLSSLHASSRLLGLMRSSNFLLDVAQPSKICARIYRPAVELVILTRRFTFCALPTKSPNF